MTILNNHTEQYQRSCQFAGYAIAVADYFGDDEEAGIVCHLDDDVSVFIPTHNYDDFGLQVLVMRAEKTMLDVEFHTDMVVANHYMTERWEQVLVNALEHVSVMRLPGFKPASMQTDTSIQIAF